MCLEIQRSPLIRLWPDAAAQRAGGLAHRAGVLAQEAIAARHKTWLGRSTVRTLRAGQRFRLSDSPLDVLGATPERSPFLTTAVTSAGINNLPKDLSAHIAERGGTTGPELLPAWVDDAVRSQVAATGYANAFEAIRADIPRRPEPLPRPKAPGPLTATVVGADGSSTPTAGAVGVLNRRLIQDAEAIAKRQAAQPRLKLRPHYRNLMDAYNAQYLRQEPLDPDVVAFFDRYVHDSLAGFAQDATLPSDPRVVYAGGNNKIRFAGAEANPPEGQPKAA